MKREELLQKASDLVNGDRAAVYGDAWDNHSRIARIWSGILGQHIKPEQVYMCMIGLKLARLANTPEHLDSWIDVAGYAALGGEGLTEKPD